jgi:ABC-type transport system substrate-binding protein
MPGVAIQLKNQFAAIGVTVNIVQKPNAAFLSTARSNDKSIGMVEWQTQSLVIDPCYHMANFVEGSGVVAFNQFNNAAFSNLVGKCMATQDGSTRDEQVKQIQTMVAQQVPTLSVLLAPEIYGLAKSVTNLVWTPYTLLNFNYFKPA